MAKERTTDVPQSWKIAAFIELCPPEVRDMDGYRCEECDVDAVASSTQCYNCGGWGHASRNCQSERKGGKGGGKDGGKGKGNPAEAGKGKSKGAGKSKGKPPQKAGGKGNPKGSKGTGKNLWPGSYKGKGKGKAQGKK